MSWLLFPRNTVLASIRLQKVFTKSTGKIMVRNRLWIRRVSPSKGQTWSWIWWWWRQGSTDSCPRCHSLFLNLKTDRRPEKTTTAAQLPNPSNLNSQVIMDLLQLLRPMPTPKRLWGFCGWCPIDWNCSSGAKSEWARRSDWAFPGDGPFHPEELHWVHGVLLGFKSSALICLIEFLNFLAINALESIATYPNGILPQFCDKDPPNDYVYCNEQSISSFSCSQKETRNDMNVLLPFE